MSNSSVAGAGKNFQNKRNSPGGEGASCGSCRRSDNSRMVQCDECDVWYHYDCVNVDDSIRDHDWSCNGCMRRALEKQRRDLSEQMQRLEQQQKHWQQEQYKQLEQMEEQHKLEQRRKQQELEQQKPEQFDQMRVRQLQLQPPSLPYEAAASELEVSSKALRIIPKQQPQLVKILEKEPKRVPERVETNDRDNMRSLAANNAKPPGGVDGASSRSSKRSVKLRQLQARALEARQALERKQLEERLALECEMLEISDSETDSSTSIGKINEWLEKTEQVGQEVRKPLDDTTLPIYDEILRKATVSSMQPRLINYDDTAGPSVQQQLARQPDSFQQHSVPQRQGRDYTHVEHPQFDGNIPRIEASYQPTFSGYPPVASGFPSLPVYSVASQQPLLKVNPAENQLHHVVQNTASVGESIGQPQLTTSTPRQNLPSSRQQY